jgi:hypothetical protein
MFNRRSRPPQALQDSLDNHVWQTPARVNDPIKYITSNSALPVFRAFEAGRGDVRVVDPELEDKRTNRMHDNDRVIVLRCDCADERVAITPCHEI